MVKLCGTKAKPVISTSWVVAATTTSAVSNAAIGRLKIREMAIEVVAIRLQSNGIAEFIVFSLL